MNERTNERTYERKDENYIPIGINAGGIITGFGDLNLEFPLILAISVFLAVEISCSAELSMKFFYDLWACSYDYISEMQ